MAHIELNGVTLDYAVYSVRAQSLRNAVMNMAVGGRLLKNQRDVTVVRALSNVTFRVSEGDRLGLIGHNGSGKTTLLKVLAGIYEPTTGMIQIEGKVNSIVAMGLGMDLEAPGTQNIRNMGMLQGMSKREVERRLPSIVEFAELGPFIHMPMKTYSAGMMARLMFAVATDSDADILIMDEWIGAGDLSFFNKAADRMRRMVESAKILALATHDTNLVQRVCNKVCVMNAGQMTYFGSTEEYFQQHAA
jgi:lipopolysaccharide transport system ATP-binding protein